MKQVGEVVRIHAGDHQAVGGGFLVDDTHVVTCAHVVADALEASAERDRSRVRTPIPQLSYRTA